MPVFQFTLLFPLFLSPITSGPSTHCPPKAVSLVDFILPTIVVAPPSTPSALPPSLGRPSPFGRAPPPPCNPCSEGPPPPSSSQWPLGPASSRPSAESGPRVGFGPPRRSPTHSSCSGLRWRPAAQPLGRYGLAGAEGERAGVGRVFDVGGQLGSGAWGERWPTAPGHY